MAPRQPQPQRVLVRSVVPGDGTQTTQSTAHQHHHQQRPALRGLHLSLHSPLLVILLSTFLHMLSLALTLAPFTELVAESIYEGQLGHAAIFISGLEACIAALQMLFDPLWGHLSDRPAIGRKPFLLLAIVQFSAEGWVLYAAPSWWSIVVVCLCRGVCGVGFTILTILLMDLSGAHPVLAPRYLGLYGAASGLGLVVGAGGGAIGAWFAGPEIPFACAGAFSALNALWVAFALKEPLIPEAAIDDELDGEQLEGADGVAAAAAAEAAEEEAESDALLTVEEAVADVADRFLPTDDAEWLPLPTTPIGSHGAVGSESIPAHTDVRDNLSSSPPSLHGSSFEAHSSNPLHSLRILLSTPTLRWLSLAFFLAFLARAYMRILLLWTKYQFAWGAKGNGIFLVYMGFCAITAQGVLLRPALHRWGQHATVYIAWSLNVVCELVYAFLPAHSDLGVVILYVTTALCCGGSVLLPLVRAAISRDVPARMQGLLGGATASLVTAAYLVGSFLYGPLFAYFTTPPPGSDGAAAHPPQLSGVPGARWLQGRLPAAPFLWPGVPFFASVCVYLLALLPLRRGLAASDAAHAERIRRTARDNQKAKAKARDKEEETGAALHYQQADAMRGTNVSAHDEDANARNVAAGPP